MQKTDGALLQAAIEGFLGSCPKNMKHLMGGRSCAENALVLKGCADLYRATGRKEYRDFMLACMRENVPESGEITGFSRDAGDDVGVGCGQTLLFALDETGDERYRRAADFLFERVDAQSRCPCGDTGHGQSLPEMLYMTQPFRTEYDRRFGGMRAARDVANGFGSARKCLTDAETGGALSFRLPDTGWYMAALADCAEKMDIQLYEHYRKLADLLLEAARTVFPRRDAETGLYSRETGDAEPLGSAMILYALLKGVRLGLLDGEKYLDDARRGFRSLASLALRRGADGAWHLADAFSFGGPMGAGVFLMALAEYERSLKA